MGRSRRLLWVCYSLSMLNMADLPDDVAALKAIVIAVHGKRCVSPVVSTWGDFGHAALQLSLQEFGDGAPK